MPTHRSPDEIAELRARAAALRAAGTGAKRIAEQLGIPYNLAQTLLRGVPVPASLMRLRAKDDLREAALALRREGRTYDEIQVELGVSKGSLTLWLRELAHPTEEQRRAVRSGTTEPAPLEVPPDAEIARALRSDGWLLREIADELGVSHVTIHRWCAGLAVPPRANRGRTPEEMRALARATWDSKNAESDRERDCLMSEIASTVGALSARELDLIAATAYWCEGSKRKPWRRSEKLTLINSDPDVIRLWVAWLTTRGVGFDRCYLAVNIHESADVERATRFWADVLGIDPADFAKPVLKRHNPKTVRKNTGEAYVGCLVIGVRQGRTLYREVEGLWRGIAGAMTP